MSSSGECVGPGGKRGRTESPAPPEDRGRMCRERRGKRVKLRRLREEMIAGRVQGGLEQIPQR